MASNFKISVRRKSDRLYLKLTGDFDGTSAFELLHYLEKSANGVARVFIDTSGLRQIYSFGQAVFQKNLFLLKGKSVRLELTGAHAAQIAPNGGRQPSLH